MRRLGEILVAGGACDPARLAEALEHQVVFGGRLGTNLLELGAVTEEALARGLAQRFGVPSLHGDVECDPAALALLKPDLADRLEVVPHSLAGRRLRVLCRDPSDLGALDEVAFATGKELVPVVVPEARLWALLRSQYGLHRPMRWGGEPARPVAPAPAPPPPPDTPDLMDEESFAALYGETALRPPAAPPWAGAGADPRAAGAELGRAGPDPIVPVLTPPPTRPRAGVVRSPEPQPPAHRQEVVRAREPPPPGRRSPLAPGAEPPAERPSIPGRPAGPGVAGDPGGRPLTDAVAAYLGAPRATAPAAEDADTPLSFAEASAALGGASGRAEIARIVLRYARTRFRRVVLLTVYPQSADGWAGAGEGIARETVARLHVPLGQPGLVQTVVSTRAHFLGPLARTEANIRFLRALAGGAPRTAFAMPILARGRVANVLYADGGRGGLVDPGCVGELLILASRIAQSYGTLIARRRA